MKFSPFEVGKNENLSNCGLDCILFENYVYHFKIPKILLCVLRDMIELFASKNICVVNGSLPWNSYGWSSISIFLSWLQIWEAIVAFATLSIESSFFFSNFAIVIMDFKATEFFHNVENREFFCHWDFPSNQFQWCTNFNLIILNFVHC